MFGVAVGRGVDVGLGVALGVTGTGIALGVAAGAAMLQLTEANITIKLINEEDRNR